MTEQASRAAPHVHDDRRRRPRHHGGRDRRGVRPQRVRRHRCRAERRGGRPRPPAPRALHRPRGQAREAHRGRGGRAAGPDHAHHHDEGPARGRLRGRGGRRVARDQEGIFRELEGIVAPDAILATNTSSPERHRDLDRQRPPGPGHRRALLQPRAGAEPRRDHPHRRHRAAGARGRHRAGRGGSARTPSSAATRPASSPTRCCSATSTTRSRCSRASSPRARTSTPRCGSAAATRWARSSCST